jgi:hypothetical protein
MWKLEISPNNRVMSVRYFTSLAMTIEPTARVQSSFVRGESPVFEATFIPSPIQ